MATIINSNQLNSYQFRGDEQLWVYNGLDTMLTAELKQNMEPNLNENTAGIYKFERAMLGPAISIMRRGVRIDHKRRKELLSGKFNADGEQIEPGLEQRIKNVAARFNYLAMEIWGKEINLNSPKQLYNFFYGEEGLQIPEIYSFKGGKRRVSTDNDTMEKMILNYLRAVPLANLLLRYRDLNKKQYVLRSKVDADGRWRSTYNVSGTETGRWSSRTSPFQTGTNMQNITKELREIIIPDKGMAMFYADLEQAESRATAYLSGDVNYIKACEGGDLHTDVCKMVWRDLPWTGNLKDDKVIAEQIFYRHFTYRDMAKRGGHGTNYYLTYKSMARRLHIEERMACRFQLEYYGGQQPLEDLHRWGYDDLIEKGQRVLLYDKEEEHDVEYVILEGAFPGIRIWHRTIENELRATGKLVTPFGRERQFWGRLNDDTTLREAIAFKPQSLVGDILNYGLLRMWNELEPRYMQTLGQVHDAVLGQVPIEEIENVEPLLIRCLMNPIEVNGRIMSIPAEVLWSTTSWKDVKKRKK